MASRTLDEFENDWTFVDKDGKVDIEPRKNSVSYSKSPSREEVLVLSPDLPAKDDSEGEAEFEVLSGFQCNPSVEAGGTHVAETADIQNDLPHYLDSETEDEFVAVHQSSCQCAADDGIMIISNHFCMDQDENSVGDVTTDENPLASEREQHDQQSLLSSTHSSDSNADGWRELPQLSESGSFSFGSDSNSSEEDNAIEPIPEEEEEEESQDFVDLSHEADPLEEMVESKCSVFSFDSDLFSPSDLDEDVDNEDDHSDITEVSEVRDDDKERDQDQEKVEEVEGHLVAESSDDDGAFHVDIPTLFVVLGLTTALGFSIGYGLSVYVSNQALGVSGSIKRPGPKTGSLPLTSDPVEPLDEVSRDFLDQLEMWKLEDRLEASKEQEPETEMEDLFDTKALHEKLQLKHFKLMGLHESVKQRLRMTKVMSWYWRLKYEEERSNKEGSEWSKALQEQLQDTEKLYLQEKQVADLWRRMNENVKLRRAVAGGIKFDRYWKDFLHRWKKSEDRSPGVNDSEKLSGSTELYETAEKKELVEINADEDPEPNAQEKTRKYIPDNIWVDFRNRWTKDSQVKGRTEKSCSKSGDCVSQDPDKRKDLTLVSEHRFLATLPGFLDRTVEKSVDDPLTRNSEPKKTESFAKDWEEIGSEINPEEISKMKHEDFKEGAPPFENPLFPNGVFPPGSKVPIHYFVKRDFKVKANPLAPTVSSNQKYLHVILFQDGRSDARWFYEDGSVVKETISPENAKEVKTLEKSLQKGSCQRSKSYEALVTRKCEEDDVAQRHKSARQSELSKKQDGIVNGNRTSIHSQGQCLTKEKEKLRNLSQLRGEEIRKQRIQRREWKKKQREAELRREVAGRLLLELRREKRRIQTEKKKLRHSWKALKREKKRISFDKELHQKDREEVKNFMRTLKEEKQKLKRKKVKLKEKISELLDKERENLKIKEKALYAENKKEVELLRNEISQEKNKLRQKKKELKSLKKAAKQEYKKWLRELRKIKRQEEEKREAEQAKLKEEARKKREKAERDRRRKREYDSVVREQAKYDKEKRSRKGEYGDHTSTRGQWRSADNDVRQDESVSHQRDSKKNAKQYDHEDSFRQQLEDVKRWLSDVHKKTIEQQRIYWPGTLLKPVFEAFSGWAENSEPREEEKPADMEDKELKQHDTNFAEEKENKYTNDGEDTPDKNEWENGRVEMRKVMSKMEKRGCELEENKRKEMTVSKSEMAKISEDKALMGFTNLTFGADLIKILLKGFDKGNRQDKTASEPGEEAESTAFIIVSEEAADRDSSGGLNVKKKKPRENPRHFDRKPKRPDDRWRGFQKWPERNLYATEKTRASPQGPIASEDRRMASEDSFEQTTMAQNVRYKVPSEGPTPPKNIGLPLEGRYEGWLNVPKTKRKPVTPQGPILFDDVDPARSSKGKKRKKRQYSDVQDKVCSPDVDSDSGESIPPPDWVFERAKGRSHQRSAPWYVRRAEDREYQRSTDKHDSQFPCGRKRKRFKGPLDPSWFFDRADDRAHQRLNNVPWYTRRAEGREAERQKGHDSWFLERGFYRRNLRDLSSWYTDQNWMPQGPSMEEHR